MKFLPALVLGALVGVRSDSCSDWETDSMMYNTTSCQGVTCCAGLTMRGISATTLQCVSEVATNYPFACPPLACLTLQSSTASCAAGTGKNGDTCEECRPGTYAGANMCQYCPAGKYAIEAGATECKSCPAGSEPIITWDDPSSATKTALSVECVECEIGSYAAPGMMCDTCKEGFWAAEKGQGLCSRCPKGQALDGAGYERYSLEPEYENVYYYAEAKLKYMPADKVNRSKDLSQFCVACPAGKAAGPAGRLPTYDWTTACESKACAEYEKGKAPSWWYNYGAGGPGNFGLAFDNGVLATPGGGNGHETCVPCTQDGDTKLFRPSVTASDSCGGCPWASDIPDTAWDAFEGTPLEKGVYDWTSTCSTECAAGMTMSVLYGRCQDTPKSVEANDPFQAICDNGEYPDPDGACVACAAGKYALAGAGWCLECPTGTTVNAEQSGCEPNAVPDCDSPAGAHLGPHSYTCMYNYFLRMDPNGVANGHSTFWGFQCEYLESVLPATADILNNIVRICAGIDYHKNDPDRGAMWGRDDDQGLWWLQMRLFRYGYPLARGAVIGSLGFYDSSLEPLIGVSGQSQVYTAMCKATPVEETDGGLGCGVFLEDADGNHLIPGMGYGYKYDPNNGPGGLPWERLPLKCSDPRAAVRGWCKVPQWAMFCPYSCGRIPAADLLCDAPTIPHVLGPSIGKGLMPHFQVNKPIRPKSMKDCANFGGKWNPFTYRLEPHCYETVTVVITAGGDVADYPKAVTDKIEQAFATELGLDADLVEATVTDANSVHITLAISAPDAGEAAAIQAEATTKLASVEAVAAILATAEVTTTVESFVGADGAVVATPSAPPPSPPGCECTAATRAADTTCDDFCTALEAAVGIGVGVLVAVIVIPIVCCALVIGIIVCICCRKKSVGAA